MKILAIDTSCDETAAAVTFEEKVLSNIIWSQASEHANFGGVMPSLAQRMHKERIDWVIKRALKTSKTDYTELDAVAVTVGPGLSIALGVGIDSARDIGQKHKLPVLPVNHIEAHLLSPFAQSNGQGSKPKFPDFPCWGVVVSGGNTIFVEITDIGRYEILAETQDDALGEALDKAARMLGLGYPGGALLEKMSKLSENNVTKLPIPLLGQEKRRIFSYSGLKTSLSRYIESQKLKNPDFPSKSDVYSLSSAFQESAFSHLTRTVEYIITDSGKNHSNLLLGGGVANNTELRRRLRKLGRKLGFSVWSPYTKKLNGDNAAMIGVCAYLKFKNANLSNFNDTSKIDRNPRLQIHDNF